MPDKNNKAGILSIQTPLTKTFKFVNETRMNAMCLIALIRQQKGKKNKAQILSIHTIIHHLTKTFKYEKETK